jgi:hypothetical protein
MATLAGVAHAVVHLGASGLNCLSRRFAGALHAVVEKTGETDLLATEPYPKSAAELDPVRSALASLKITAEALVANLFFLPVRRLPVFFAPLLPRGRKPGYSLRTRALITLRVVSTHDSGWLKGSRRCRSIHPKRRLPMALLASGVESRC